MIQPGSLSGRQPPPLIGLDLSSSSVRLVELGRDREGRHILERCATEHLERGCISEGHIEKFDEVAEAIRRVVRRSGTRTRQVAMALPASAVITKRIVLPAGMTDPELEVQVEAEASQYIPFSLDEVSLDFCVVGPGPGSQGEIEVLLAASRKEKVQDRQGLAEAAGLRPVILDIESYASRLAVARLIDALPRGGADTLVALFELGALSSGMQIIRNGAVLYDRDQPFGGAQLTQQVMRHYRLPLEEAEARKRSGDLPGDYAAGVLAPFVDGMAQEITRALQFFFASTPHHRVHGILLAGGCAVLPGLAEAVASHTTFPCTLADPFDGMRLADTVRDRKLRPEAPAYLTACGLAMRRFLQ